MTACVQCLLHPDTAMTIESSAFNKVESSAFNGAAVVPSPPDEHDLSSAPPECTLRRLATEVLSRGRQGAGHKPLSAGPRHHRVRRWGVVRESWMHAAIVPNAGRRGPVSRVHVSGGATADHDYMGGVGGRRVSKTREEKESAAPRLPAASL